MKKTMTPQIRGRVKFFLPIIALSLIGAACDSSDEEKLALPQVSIAIDTIGADTLRLGHDSVHARPDTLAIIPPDTPPIGGASTAAGRRLRH